MRSRIASVVAVVLSGTAFGATPAEQALKQQVDKLQAQNAAQDKQLANMQQLVTKARANDAVNDKTIATLKQQVEQLQADLKKAKGNDGADDKAIKALQTQIDTLRKVKTIRTIVYKSKADSPKTEIQSLADDANQFFATVKPVRGVWAGKTSSDTGDYHVVIVLLFDDANGLQTFQKDPQWKRFTDKHAKLWEEPKFYDGSIGK